MNIYGKRTFCLILTTSESFFKVNTFKVKVRTGLDECQCKGWGQIFSSGTCLGRGLGLGFKTVRKLLLPPFCHHTHKGGRHVLCGQINKGGLHNGSLLLCLPIFSSARLAVARFFFFFFPLVCKQQVCALFVCVRVCSEWGCVIMRVYVWALQAYHPSHCAGGMSHLGCPEVTLGICLWFWGWYMSWLVSHQC